MIGVDEYASRLDPEIGAEKLRHPPVRLMRDDVIYCVDGDPERTCDRRSLIEQLGSASPHHHTIVLELECPPFNERHIGAARGKGEAGCPTEADLAEEVVRETRAGSRLVGCDDDRRGPIPH